MLWYKNIKLSSVNFTTLSGPAVDALLEIVHKMQSYQLASEQHMTVEQNSMGWTKGHSVSPVVQKALSYPYGSEVPVTEITALLNILSTYQNTQVPEFTKIKEDLKTAFREKAKSGVKSGPQDEKFVKFIGNSTFGKLTFQINDLSAAKINSVNTGKPVLLSREITQALRTKMEEAQEVNPQWKAGYDAYGKFAFPVYKVFSNNKTNGIDCYDIHPYFIPTVADLLEKAGYNVSELLKYANTKEDPSQKNKEKEKPKILVQFLDLTDDSVKIKIPWLGEIKTKSLMTALKDASDVSFWRWDSANKLWVLSFEKNGKFITKDNLTKIKEVFSSFSLDTPDLDPIIDNYKDKVSESGTGSENVGFLKATVIGVPGQNKFFQIMIDQPGKKTLHGQVFADLLKFGFPQWGNEPERPDGKKLNLYNPGEINNSHDPIRGSSDYKTVLRGRASDYLDFIKALQNGENINGQSIQFDTTSLLQAFTSAMQQKMIYEDKIPGTLDGFLDADGKNDYDKFNTTLNNYNDNMNGYWRNKGKGKKELYPLQKEAIARIYSNTGYILGDHVGVGKTVQLIAAGDMRLKQIGPNARALVVTLVSAKEQLKRAICEACGYDDQNGKPVDVGFISINNNQDITDPDLKIVDGNKRWTILSYSQFANGKKENIELLVNKIQKTNYDLLILDEIHKIKNDSSTSNNILSCIDHIPYRWGASATIAANKPTDVLRPLKAIGHRLGNLSVSKFKEEFGGMTPQYNEFAKKVVMVEGSPEQQKEAARKFAKHLARAGIYEQKTKEQVRPELIGKFSQESLPVGIDNELFESQVWDKLSDYKDPELRISEIIAQREVVAKHKVPFTVEQVISQLSDPTKKVIVFTCFAGPLEMIKSQIENHFAKEGLNRKVTTIQGGLSNEIRQSNIESFKSNKNEAPLMIINVRAGGTAIDLPDTAELVIHNDFEFSPADEKQAQGRAKRISNNKAVTDLYIIAGDSPDEINFNYVMRKMEISEIIESAKREYASVAAQGGNTFNIDEKLKNAELASEKAFAEFQENMLKWKQNKHGIKNANNWYSLVKVASFIDNVQALSCTDNTLSLLIHGKRYNYSNIPGKTLYSLIDSWKKWKNKKLAGEKISMLIKNIQKNIES